MKGFIRLYQDFFASPKVMRGDCNNYATLLNEFGDCFAHFVLSQ